MINYFAAPGHYIQHAPKTIEESDIKTIRSEYYNIDAIICELIGTSLKEIGGANRKRELTDKRHLFCYLMLKYSVKHGLKYIGDKINRSHCSVLHADRKVKDLMDIDKDYRQYVYGISSKLTTHNNF